MLKLLIQIPCFNEADSIASVLSEIPKEIPGIDLLETLLIDDSSTDGTLELAKAAGVRHIISMAGPNRRKLGLAFQAGMNFALANGFDILVNTDGDNQYPSSAIPALIVPIVENRADIVIGNRKPHQCRHFSYFKRLMQHLGNRLISLLCRQDIPDAVSGFRAFSLMALQKLELEIEYSYTIESLMQACKKDLRIEWVDIETNPPARPSRLFRNIWMSIWMSCFIIVRLYIEYYLLGKKAAAVSQIGNIENKDNPRNLIARCLIKTYDANFLDLVKRAEPSSIHEVGCGEGRLYRLIHKDTEISRRLSGFKLSDLSGERLSEAEKQNFEIKSVYELGEKDKADLIICAEVLEHLADPKAALRAISRTKSRYYIFSVPNEPLWRALNILRLKYVTALGNTPGHINHWNRATLKSLLRQEGFEVIEERSPLPWLMVLAKVRS